MTVRALEPRAFQKNQKQSSRADMLKILQNHRKTSAIESLSQITGLFPRLCQIKTLLQFSHVSSAKRNI